MTNIYNGRRDTGEKVLWSSTTVHFIIARSQWNFSNECGVSVKSLRLTFSRVRLLVPAIRVEKYIVFHVKVPSFLDRFQQNLEFMYSSTGSRYMVEKVFLFSCNEILVIEG